jgi:hypothetical protein
MRVIFGPAFARVKELVSILRANEKSSSPIPLEKVAAGRIRGNFTIVFGLKHANAFWSDLYKEPKADYILANPPFNMSDWGGGDMRRCKRGRS